MTSTEVLRVISSVTKGDDSRLGELGEALEAASKNGGPSGLDDEDDSGLPAPINNGVFRRILKELPDGARIAAETCVRFWKDKKFPTEELMAFLKTISVHSPTLKKGFEDQHQGFLRAMKLQEEQQRQREQEELSMRSGMWQGGPQHGPSHPPPHWASPGLYPYGPVHGPYGHHMHQSPGMYPSGAYHNEMGSYPMSYGGGIAPGGAIHEHWDRMHIPPLTEQEHQVPVSTSSGASTGGNPKRQRSGKEITSEKEEERGNSQMKSDSDGWDEWHSINSHKRSRGAPDSTPSPSDTELREAKAALQGFTARALRDDPLGQHLTRRVQGVTSAVFVKVVADTFQEEPARGSGSPHERGEDFESASNHKEGGDGASFRESFAYRSKAVLAFRCLPGAACDAITFGMYTREYNASAPEALRGRAMIEGFDSTPLYNGETQEERQRCLTAIVEGYIEYVSALGFTSVLLRVPPPTDDCSHIFSPRTLAVRCKASQHVALWYRRMLQGAQDRGIVSQFDFSPDRSTAGFPAEALTQEEEEAEAHFALFQAKAGDAKSRAVLDALARTDRFYVAYLGGTARHSNAPPTLGDHLPTLESPVAEQRRALNSFCAQERLCFHTVAHAQRSTMVLLRALRADQDEQEAAWEPAAAPTPRSTSGVLVLEDAILGGGAEEGILAP